MRALVIALLPLLLLCTCDPAPTIEEETDALGYRSEFQIDPATGQRNGYLKQFDPDGNLVVEETYANGQLQGPRYTYYPDGRPETEETYRDGQFEGAYRTYDDAGNLRQAGQYVNGSMNKAWSRYYPNGNPMEVVTFVDNLEQGPFREWYENGQPKAAGNYLDGDSENGVLHLFAEDGQLERVMECDRGACTTVWRADDGGQPPVAPPNMTPPAPPTR